MVDVVVMASYNLQLMSRVELSGCTDSRSVEASADAPYHASPPLVCYPAGGKWRQAAMESVSPFTLAVSRIALGLGRFGYPVLAMAYDETQETVAFAVEQGVIVTFPAAAVDDYTELAYNVARLLGESGVRPQGVNPRRPVLVDRRTLDYWLFLRYLVLRSRESSSSPRNAR